MFALEIDSLSKTYSTKIKQKIIALQDISFNIEQGEVFGFLGPNGAGKSTTIKCLMGLIKPSSGIAKIMGQDVGDSKARSLVGYLPENPSFFDYLTAEEYVRFVAKSFNVAENLIEIRMEKYLKLLELWDVRKRLIRSYSKGMVQRVGLAQVLIHDPDIYILDEPMSGLDPVGRSLVKELIIELKSLGKSIFFSTHITDDVEKVCDRVAVINNGKLLVVDSVENILEKGVEGYCVTVLVDNRKTDCFVKQSDLDDFINQSVKNHQKIERIEPRRKDMEAFFLEIVSR